MAATTHPSFCPRMAICLERALQLPDGSLGPGSMGILRGVDPSDVRCKKVKSFGSRRCVLLEILGNGPIEWPRWLAANLARRQSSARTLPGPAVRKLLSRIVATPRL